MGSTPKKCQKWWIDANHRSTKRWRGLPYWLHDLNAQITNSVPILTSSSRKNNIPPLRGRAQFIVPVMTGMPLLQSNPSNAVHLVLSDFPQKQRTAPKSTTKYWQGYLNYCYKRPNLMNSGLCLLETGKPIVHLCLHQHNYTHQITLIAHDICHVWDAEMSQVLIKTAQILE